MLMTYFIWTFYIFLSLYELINAIFFQCKPPLLSMLYLSDDLEGWLRLEHLHNRIILRLWRAGPQSFTQVIWYKSLQSSWNYISSYQNFLLLFLKNIKPMIMSAISGISYIEKKSYFLLLINEWLKLLYLSHPGDKISTRTPVPMFIMFFFYKLC